MGNRDLVGLWKGTPALTEIRGLGQVLTHREAGVKAEAPAETASTVEAAKLLESQNQDGGPGPLRRCWASLNKPRFLPLGDMRKVWAGKFRTA